MAKEKIKEKIESENPAPKVTAKPPKTGYNPAQGFNDGAKEKPAPAAGFNPLHFHKTLKPQQISGPAGFNPVKASQKKEAE